MSTTSTKVKEFIHLNSALLKWKCVIGEPFLDLKKNRCVTLQCECGKIKEVKTTNLFRFVSKSCGCHKPKSQGTRDDKLYHVWHAIRSRIFNPESPSYLDYGGRGLTMDIGWSQDFIIFRKWALENGYKEGLTIDRIDNDIGYCPSNCRWTTQYHQSRNKRSNVLITLNGKTQILADWCKEMNIHPNTVWGRVRQRGWSYEKALTTPPLTKGRKK
jgi:hypothetical protein